MKAHGAVLIQMSLILLIHAWIPFKADAEDPSAHDLIFQALEKFKTVETYTCRLEKRVLKNEKLYEDLNISVKYQKPKHYYFRWNDGPSRGREVIFVEGRNHNKLVAHPGGLFKWITLQLDPESDLAMKEVHHPLTHSGMEKIISLIESNYALALKNGVDGIQLKGQGGLDGTPIWILECRFPDRQGFYAPKMILGFSEKHKLPVMVTIYQEDGRLFEEYIFHDLKMNTSLSEKDFDPANPEYRYVGREPR